MQFLTGTQCRMARALLRWTEPELAKNAQVSLYAIRKIEAFDGLANIKASDLQLIHDAFLATGKIEFTVAGIVPIISGSN